MAEKSIKSVKCAIEAVRNKIEFLDNFMEKDAIFGMKTEGCLFPDEMNWFYVYFNPTDTEFKKDFYLTLIEDRRYLTEKTGCVLSKDEIRNYGSCFKLETDKDNRNSTGGEK